MPIISIKVDEKQFKELKEKARKHGFETISDYLLSIIKEGEKIIPEEKEKESLEQKISFLVKRKIEDAINPYTEKIDLLARNISLLMERMDKLEEKIAELKEVPPPPQQTRVVQRRQTKMTAIDHLRKDKIVVQSELGWLNRPKAFFDKLKREGAIVFKSQQEYVAVDSDFWNDFLEKLSELESEDPEVIKRSLPDKMALLFDLLLKEGMVFYDQIEKKWIVAVEE